MSAVEMNTPPKATRGPNGLVELKQMNGVQGWHSGYMTPKRARQVASEIVAVADEMEAS